MDLRRVRVGEWLLTIGGAALLGSLWLPWWKAADGATATAWQALSLLDALLALLALAAIAVAALVSVARAAGPGVAAEALLTPFALALAVACALRVGNAPPALGAATAAHGAWIGLAATVGVLVGALVGMRDERLSGPGRPTDQTGAPLAEPIDVETLPAPPRA